MTKSTSLVRGVFRALRIFFVASFAALFFLLPFCAAQQPGTKPPTEVISITPGYKVKGGLAGETVGYNWQMQNWVVGVEGDMSWANVRGFTHESSPPFGGGIVQTNEGWLATGRARLGFTITNNVMVFATGGIAAAGVAANILPLAAAERTETHVRWGGTFGGGIESKITAKWSVKAEYLYANFASQSYYDNPPPGTNTRSNVPIDNNIFRVGFNYALQ